MTETAWITGAKAENVEEIVALNSALFAEDAGSRDPLTDLGWPEAEGRDHFLDLIDREDAVCLLARVRGTTAGYLAGYVSEPSRLRPVRTAELESMYVLADYRAVGLGRRLVEGFCSWARHLGADRMSVTAYAANDRAIRFYKREGFEPMTVSLEMSL